MTVYGFLLHLALAAACAMELRCSGLRFVAVSTTRRALANESESLLERFGMIEPDSHTQTGKSRGLKLKLAHYRQS